nr:outer membrane beta-barrel protein [uncultured Fluviicola sp.]
MKKLSLLLGGIILSTAVMAQKPTEGNPLSVEGQIGLSGLGGGTNLNFTAPALRLRYFVTSNIAVRLTVGLDNAKTTLNAYEFADGTGNSGTYETKRSNTNIAVGAEYHFEGTARLSPYVGLDIKFGMGGMKETGDNAGLIAGNAVYALNYAEKFTAKTSMFGVNLVAGTDFYFAENFYVGLELGLGFGATTAKDGTREVTVSGSPTVTTVTPEVKSSTFSNNFITNFRLGWRF